VQFKKIATLSFCLAVGGVSYPFLVGQTAAAGDGIYTAEQAHRGEVLYQQQCISCHGAAMDGAGPYPPLSGDEFLTKYEGQPALSLYDMIQKLMPATKPGSLSRPEAADLLAYILSFNKFPAGKTELPSDEDSLKKLVLPKPPAPKA
jgi:mono/diheme cytochrome c family protein